MQFAARIAEERIGGGPASTALLLVALVGAVGAPPAHAGEEVRRLSDERTVNRWAHPVAAGRLQERPGSSPGRTWRLRLETEDRRPEVYVVLRRETLAGTSWSHVRVPGWPGAPRSAWVRSDLLGGLRRAEGRLVVDRRTLRATLFGRDGSVRLRARVGVGARSTPTPGGTFYVRERLPGRVGTIYGPWAFGLSAYARVTDWPRGGVVGIHGTNRPELVPGRPSNGCVRLRDADVRRLAARLPIGTAVEIR